MSLTLTPPTSDRLQSKTSHDNAFYRQKDVTQSSAHYLNGPVRSSPYPAYQTMSTPHRGLPLPGPMTLSNDPRTNAQPHPQQQQQQQQQQQPLYTPLQPQHVHVQGDERAGQEWYYASKAEDDKRRQQEEATRQEELKLEQRRIERDMLRESRDMLRESIGAGVPPHLVPLIFLRASAGTGASADMMQQLYGQIASVSQQVQGLPPAASNPQSELRRETRNITQAAQSFSAPNQGQSQTGPGQPLPQHIAAVAGAYPSPAYASPANPRGVHDPAAYAAAAQAEKTSVISGLPRLTTNQAQIHQAPSGSAYVPTTQERASPSPSIYFHHWQPPSATQTAPQSATAVASKEALKTSPNQNTQLANDHTDSPRKRKAQGPHQPAPRPSSPSFSEMSALSSRQGGHARQSSDQSTRGYDPVGRGNRHMPRRNSSQDERHFRKEAPAGRRLSVDPQPLRTESTKSSAS